MYFFYYLHSIFLVLGGSPVESAYSAVTLYVKRHHAAQIAELSLLKRRPGSGLTAVILERVKYRVRQGSE